MRRIVALTASLAIGLAPALAIAATPQFQTPPAAAQPIPDGTVVRSPKRARRCMTSLVYRLNTRTR